MKKCDRCKKIANIYKMSFFNTEKCCMDCIKKEEKHKLYKKAVEMEMIQYKLGNKDYPGIGLPDDLKG